MSAEVFEAALSSGDVAALRRASLAFFIEESLSSASGGNSSRYPANFVCAVEMAAAIVQGDSNGARTAWSRQADAVKGDPVVSQLAQIADLLRKGDDAQALTLMHSFTSPAEAVSSLVRVTHAAHRQRVLDLVGSTYASLHIDSLTSLLAADREQTLQCVRDRGWVLDEATGLVAPRAATAAPRVLPPDQRQMQQLVKTAVELENTIA